MVRRVDRLARLFAPFRPMCSGSTGDIRPPIEPLSPACRISALWNRPAHVLDVQAIKDRLLPSGYDHSEGRTDPLAKLWIKPPSFARYGAARQMGSLRSHSFEAVLGSSEVEISSCLMTGR